MRCMIRSHDAGWKPFEKLLHSRCANVFPRIADQVPRRAWVMPRVVERGPAQGSTLALAHARGEQIGLGPALDELFLHGVRVKRDFVCFAHALPMMNQ